MNNVKNETRNKASLEPRVMVAPRTGPWPTTLSARLRSLAWQIVTLIHPEPSMVGLVQHQDDLVMSGTAIVAAYRWKSSSLKYMRYKEKLNTEPDFKSWVLHKARIVFPSGISPLSNNKVWLALKLAAFLFPPSYYFYPINGR
jgi:hypothetical protein